MFGWWQWLRSAQPSGCNQAYNNKVGPLRNPHSDIAVVGKALTDVGFKLLAPLKDATRDEILFAVHELAAQVRAAGRDTVSFLYYAGHGVAVGGENVLIPTNAEDTSDAMLSVRGVRLGEILDILKRDAPDAVHFVVLDACRNIRGRRGDRGFVPVNDRRTGVVIAFSTAPGETATDEGANGAPYALALADEIIKPGRTDQVVFNAVRARVVNAARGQTPWTHDGLIGERVMFKAAPGQLVPATVPPPPIQPQMSEAALAWQLIKDTTDVRALEAFIRRFGDTYYSDLAKVRLVQLKEAETAKQAAEAAKKKVEEDARPTAALGQPMLQRPTENLQTTCGWYAIAYCSQEWAAAQTQTGNYGGRIINTSDFAKFRPGWFCVVEGPMLKDAATVTVQRMKGAGATTAYVKNSC